MIGGVFAIVAFHLADTYFVSKLGTQALAAMGFTFPVVMLIGSIGMGMGMGTASVISRALGEGNHGGVRRLATDSLLLSVSVVILFAVTGILTVNPLFRLLGAKPDILPLIRQYMIIWYIGVVFLIVPMVGNNAIRASGDTKFPSLIMMIGALINVVLDPLLIFGIGPFPRLELAGAAIATVIGRATTMVVSLSILHFRERMLDFSRPALRSVWESWKKILYIGIPASATNILQPLSMSLVTRMAAGFGPEAVAALGAGGRIGSLAMIALFALAISLIPFIGQNWGAGEQARARRGHWVSCLFSFGWGLFMIPLFFYCSRPLALLFSRDPKVIPNIVLLLRIIPLGYGLRGISRLASSTLNAINRPLISAALNIIRLFVFFVPLSFAGSRLFHLKGLFWGMSTAEILAGAVAILWVREVLRRAEKEAGAQT
jgi:putative MATE family efflux protein